MKEHPIIFSTPMIKAILEGRKTQTRRVIKEPVISTKYKDEKLNVKVGERYIQCPYGQLGDLLYIREKFRMERPFTGNIDYDLIHENIFYYASDHEKYRDKDKWKPSIHMPRKYARIFLEIINIRVERVQEITEDDCQAEGLKLLQGGIKSEFAILWDVINLKRGFGWAVNPYVWVIEFKRFKR